MSLSRRQVLQGLGWTTAGVTIFAHRASALSLLPALPYRKDPSPEDAASWLSLRPDGRIEILMPRAEMGQGVTIAFRQIVAEETRFPIARVVATHPRTDRLQPTRATVGSDSIKDFAPSIAKAAAALGAVLKRVGVVDGVAPPGGWATLTKSPRIIDASSVDRAKPISFSEKTTRRVVGKPMATDQIRAIVTGENPLYADDVRFSDMVFGSPLRAPRLDATLTSVDDTPARALPGYLGLHRIDGYTFVAAANRGALERSLAAVKPNWTGGDKTQADINQAIDIDRALARGALEHSVAADHFEPRRKPQIDLRLEVPMAAHACIEPRTAVARFDAAGKLDIWTGTQDVTYIQAFLAKALGLRLDDIVVHNCRLGGGFGGKTICRVELEAAVLARALRRPVKVQWTRLDEFREAFHRPPSSHRIRARMTADGALDQWHHAFRSGHVIFTSAAMGPVLQFGTSFVADPGVQRGCMHPYATRQNRIEFEDVRLPVQTGPWRGLGAGPNAWAIETAIDALARYRREDPVALRKRLIAPQWPRLLRVLDRIALQTKWTDLKSTPTLGYGVACGVYKDMSYAAVVAEVMRAGDQLRVNKMWCVHDCGVMINPDQVKAQVEGNLVWGLGMALHEELKVDRGHVSASSFADYAVPRFSDVPDMVIDLLSEANDPPSGAGETAIVAATAAITNAIAVMTGKPVTRLPWRPQPN